MSTEHDQSDWPHVIGTYITSFAYVELLVYEIFELLPQDNVVRSHSSLRDFSERTRLLQALLRSTDWDSRAEIEKLLEELLEHGTLRNKLAHNPLFIDVYVDGENMVTSGKLQRTKKRTPLDHISLEMLSKKQSQLNSLATDLAFHVDFIKG